MGPQPVPGIQTAVHGFFDCLNPFKAHPVPHQPKLTVWHSKALAPYGVQSIDPYSTFLIRAEDVVLPSLSYLQRFEEVSAGVVFSLRHKYFIMRRYASGFDATCQPRVIKIVNLTDLSSEPACSAASEKSECLSTARRSNHAPEPLDE